MLFRRQRSKSQQEGIKGGRWPDTIGSHRRFPQSYSTTQLLNFSPEQCIIGSLFSTEVIFWFWLQGSKRTDRCAEVNLISHFVNGRTAWKLNAVVGGGEGYLTACHLDLISSRLCLWKREDLVICLFPFLCNKNVHCSWLLLVFSPSVLSQEENELGKFLRSQGFQDKTRAGKWCKRQERPSAFLPSKGVWPSLGSADGDRGRGGLLRTWGPLTCEGNLPLVFREPLSEIEGLLCSQLLVCLYSTLR